VPWTLAARGEADRRGGASVRRTRCVRGLPIAITLPPGRAANRGALHYPLRLTVRGLCAPSSKRHADFLPGARRTARDRMSRPDDEVSRSSRRSSGGPRPNCRKRGLARAALPLCILAELRREDPYGLDRGTSRRARPKPADTVYDLLADGWPISTTKYSSTSDRRWRPLSSCAPLRIGLGSRPRGRRGRPVGTRGVRAERRSRWSRRDVGSRTRPLTKAGRLSTSARPTNP